MFSLATHTQQPPDVMALFHDGAESFSLSKGTTLAELAEFIDELQSRHNGAPVAVNVQFVPPTMTRTPLRKAASRRKKSAARYSMDELCIIGAAQISKGSAGNLLRCSSADQAAAAFARSASSIA